MSTPQRPNVVWLAMEDVSPRFGCTGDDLARTPRVDALASEGRRYPNTFCTAPVCAPSRSAVMTGCHQNRIGTHHMRTDTHDRAGLPDSYDAVPPHYVTAITEYFRRAGYCCTLDSKTDYQFGEPFTMWDRHADGAGWWDRDREDQPFFAMFTNGVTHESGMWDPDLTDWRAGGALDPPETDPAAVDVPPYLPDTDATREAIARHYDNLAASDAWVGDLLDRLAADGHAENTVVVLWSDHGEGLPRCKRWPYDSGTNVPLIVRWPGELDGGDVDERLVSLHDLGPAMLDACGLAVPPYVDGQSFLGDAPEREYVVSTRDRYDEEYDMVRSVRGPRYRYVRHYRPGRPYRQWIPYRNRHPAMEALLERAASGELQGAERWFDANRPAEELYDLDADPHEVENLIGGPELEPEHADALARLRGALDDWRERVDDVGDVAETEMVHSRYEGGDQPTTATPVFVPNAPGNREREPIAGTVELDGPATLSLYCATQGASLGYRVESVDDTDAGDAGEAHWHLYTGPIDLPAGKTTVRAKAVRYGYAESDEATVTVTVPA
jgi:arylsulfatase A-like enzyme